MKKLFAFSHLKYILFVAMIIAIMVNNLQGTPAQSEQSIADNSIKTIYTNELQSMHSAYALAQEAKLEGDTSIIETDGNGEPVASMWVDGKSVPMSTEQIDELEEKIYKCKSQEEYEALMGTLQYYNKGVDLSRFSWFWDEMEPLYSDKQIAQMKSGKREWKKVPDVVGMKAREAYNRMVDAGFITREIGRAHV